jgi:uncharacterized membrane protein YqjE
MDADKFCAQQPIQSRPVGSWASIVVNYFDSKARLLAIEPIKGSQHLVGLLMLVGLVAVLASSSILTYSGFLLYLVSLLLHLPWGRSALTSAVILSLPCVVDFFLLRLRFREPVFRMMLKDLEKDKQWLGQSKTKAY